MIFINPWLPDAIKVKAQIKTPMNIQKAKIIICIERINNDGKHFK